MQTVRRFSIAGSNVAYFTNAAAELVMVGWQDPGYSELMEVRSQQIAAEAGNQQARARYMEAYASWQLAIEQGRDPGTPAPERPTMTVVTPGPEYQPVVETRAFDPPLPAGKRR